MKKILSLIIFILMMMSLLISCYVYTDEVKQFDIKSEVERELSDDGEYYVFTLRLHSQIRKNIKGLVLGIHFYNEDGEYIGMTYLKVGDVNFGTMYKFQFDINSRINMTLEEQETAKIHVQVLGGSVVL